MSNPTNFFSELNLLLESIDLTFTISKRNGRIAVMLDPKMINKSDVQFPPFIVRGMANELDEEFFKVLNGKAQQEIKGIVDNVEENIKLMKAIENEEKRKKDEKLGKKKTAPKPQSASTVIKDEEDEEEEDDDNDSILGEPTSASAPAAIEQPKLF